MSLQYELDHPFYLDLSRWYVSEMDREKTETLSVSEEYTRKNLRQLLLICL